MKKTGLLTFLLTLAALTVAGTSAVAGTDAKRKPANAPNILCLKSVSEAFHSKWDPVRDQIRNQSLVISEKQRNSLHKQSRKLLLAKAEAIKSCTINAKNISLKKVLTPFN